MTVTDLRVPGPRPAPHDAPTATPESDRVAELQQMIRSGRYSGNLAELADEAAIR